jgi:hypothetical protein
LRITEDQLTKRVEKWRKRIEPLGIGHFTITGLHIVDETPGGPDAEASAYISHNYDNVRMWFAAPFLAEATSQQVDETILHELVHIGMRDVDRATDPVERYMPVATFEDFADRLLHEKEKFVDRVAKTIYSTYHAKT